MDTNFLIKENIYLLFNKNQIDLHNDYNLSYFNYNLKKNLITFYFEKIEGDWNKNNKLKSFKLLHKNIYYLQLDNPDQESIDDDKQTIGEISFFPSTSREINNSIIDKQKPDKDDDIIYFFESGQYLRINCDEINIVI